METSVDPPPEASKQPSARPKAWFTVRGPLLWLLVLSVATLIFVVRHHTPHWEALRAAAAALALMMTIAEARRLHRMGKLRGFRLPSLAKRHTRTPGP